MVKQRFFNGDIVRYVREQKLRNGAVIPRGQLAVVYRAGPSFEEMPDPCLTYGEGDHPIYSIQFLPRGGNTIESGEAPMLELVERTPETMQIQELMAARQRRLDMMLFEAKKGR